MQTKILMSKQHCGLETLISTCISAVLVMEELLFYLFRLITILGSSSALCTKRNSPVVDDG
jgi:hypothetical protein